MYILGARGSERERETLEKSWRSSASSSAMLIQRLHHYLNIQNDEYMEEWTGWRSFWDDYVKLNERGGWNAGIIIIMMILSSIHSLQHILYKGVQKKEKGWKMKFSMDPQDQDEDGAPMRGEERESRLHHCQGSSSSVRFGDATSSYRDHHQGVIHLSSSWSWRQSDEKKVKVCECPEGNTAKGLNTSSSSPPSVLGVIGIARNSGITFSPWYQLKISFSHD